MDGVPGGSTLTKKSRDNTPTREVQAVRGRVPNVGPSSPPHAQCAELANQALMATITWHVYWSPWCGLEVTDYGRNGRKSRQMSEADDAGYPEEDALQQAAYIARQIGNSRRGNNEVGSTWSWAKAVRQVEAHPWQHPKGLGERAALCLYHEQLRWLFCRTAASEKAITGGISQRGSRPRSATQQFDPGNGSDISSRLARWLVRAERCELMRGPTGEYGSLMVLSGMGKARQSGNNPSFPPLLLWWPRGRAP